MTGEGPSPLGFGIYVHWPFCLSKCPYCDFNSHVTDTVDHPRWRAALLRELGAYAGETADKTVTSLFFGGGTPSLMDPGTVARVVDATRRLWPCADDLEVTLEANPSSVEAGRFAAFADAGVNRLSMGVQSLDDRALKFLGRGHDAAEAQRAIATAAARFTRRSFDLIYARPGQTVAAWRGELADAVTLADGHLSVYQLTIEPGTAFRKARVQAADEDTAAALFDVTGDILSRAGLPAYEVSSHARPGQECRHNLTYWQGGDYVGVGPGAHGRLTKGRVTEAIRNAPAPMAWLTAVETRGAGGVNRAALTFEARRDEVVMMGLRLTRGIGRPHFRRATGRTFEDALPAEGLARLIDGGFLELDDDGLRATSAGLPCLNAVIGALLT